MSENMTEDKKRLEQLAKLRLPFDADQISKLPKPTASQTAQVKADFKIGIRCKLCGGWHHKDVVHLDYVGHAALTNRLLIVDPEWNWEPLVTGDNNLPLLDPADGLWIKLTICGVTRLGFGDAAGKQGGDAMKERIGDALRNAAMRFGCALDLWHKGDSLFCDDDFNGGNDNKVKPEKEPAPTYILEKKQLKACGSIDALATAWGGLDGDAKTALKEIKDQCKADIDKANESDIPQ